MLQEAGVADGGLLHDGEIFWACHELLSRASRTTIDKSYRGNVCEQRPGSHSVGGHLQSANTACTRGALLQKSLCRKT
jgi:hypothetical protein